MPNAPRVLFVPCAAGDDSFWRPVGELLPTGREKLYLDWPGLGEQPRDASVDGFEDLAERLAGALTRPCDLVAHSMGSLVASGSPCVGVAAPVGHPRALPGGRPPPRA